MSYNQFERKYSLKLGPSGSPGIEITDLKIVFSIKKNCQESPNESIVSIYNLSDNTMNKIQEEFDTLILDAGYNEYIRTIYKGHIRYVSKKREGVDKVTVIECGDGDQFYNAQKINKTLAAGTTDSDTVRELISGAKDTVLGYVKGLNPNPRPRPKIMSGNARDYIRNVAKSNDLTWSIQDGQLTILGANDVLPNKAVELNGETGLIGLPEQTEKGIKVKCLLNPGMKVNGVIKLNNTDIFRKKSKKSRIKGQEKKLSALDKDGL